MRKLSIILLTFLLTSCHWVHKMDIEQGNVYTPEMVDKLHVGMTKNQVISIMGTPMLLNTFSDNHMDYIYTYKRGGAPMTEKRVTLIFNKQGILQRIEK